MYISACRRMPEALLKHNVKISYYPDGKNKVLVASKPIFLEDGCERAWDKEKVPKLQSKNNDVRDDSVLRAMHTVYDIARLNDFKWFFTWTLDQNKIDRKDPKEVSKKLRKFLNHAVSRNNLKYLIIPEFHSDGEGIHMHGLLNGDLKMVESGKVIVKERKNPVSKEKALKNKWTVLRTIYNMPQWKYGWSTAIELDDNKEAVSRYITKYISKDFRKIFGNFYYAGGHGLTRKPPTQLYDINYHDINTKEYTKFGTGYKYLELADNSTGEADANVCAILEAIGELNYG